MEPSHPTEPGASSEIQLSIRSRALSLSETFPWITWTNIVVLLVVVDWALGRYSCGAQAARPTKAPPRGGLKPVPGGHERGRGTLCLLLARLRGYLDGVSENVSKTPSEATQVTDMGALLAEQTREVTPAAVIADRYRLERLLGNGGMADVVLATDLVLDRQVAVKLLRETTDNEGDLSRFLAETHTLARLSHPGLVTVLDGGTMPAGHPYLVMELVDGPTLSASLETPMDPVRVAEIGAQVAAALAYAHTQGVVHRDVKPGNVLLRGDGRVKLADFGIAKLVGDQSPPHPDRDRARLGPLPRSRAGRLRGDHPGRRRLRPRTAAAALPDRPARVRRAHHRVRARAADRRPEVPADLPSGWRELLTSMTARAPQDRPTAADVAGRLAWLSGARTPTRVVPSPPVVPPSAARTHSRRLTAASWLAQPGPGSHRSPSVSCSWPCSSSPPPPWRARTREPTSPSPKPPSSQADPGPQTEAVTDQQVAQVEPVAQAVAPTAEEPAAAGLAPAEGQAPQEQGQGQGQGQGQTRQGQTRQGQTGQVTRRCNGPAWP